MKTEFNEIDSRAFGGVVLGIADFEPNSDFASFERHYVTEFAPRYVSCKVPVGDLAAIHELEAAGFRLVEVQITGDFPVTKQNVGGQPYCFEKVTSPDVLAEVLEIAGASFDLDRYSMDPAIGPVLGGRRYQEYVKRSFVAADEEVWRLFDPDDGRTVSFKTHRFTAPGRAIALLNAVHVDHKGSGIGFLADRYYLNYLHQSGVTRVTTSFSAAHRVIMQHLVCNLRLKVRASAAVLRKIY